jgi:hypothetical protein
VHGLTYTVTGQPARHRLELRTVPFKGFWEAAPDAWSNVAEVKVRGTAPANVLVIGDSGTIGSTGDWTWRYRLWEHLATVAPGQVDFVGSRDDLFDQGSRTYGHQDYVDPDFDRDHAGHWGLSFAFPETPVDQVVTDHDVDVVVEMLGIDDLAFLLHTPARVAADARDLVASARAANPDVDVVLGEVTQTWLPGAAELNVRLHDLAAELDDAQSRVVVAETADGFSRRLDTYDRSHANARGEVRIAAALADALAAAGLGAPYPRPLPVVPNGPRSPVRVQARVHDGKVTLRWTDSPGADSYRVLIRRPGSPGWRRAAQTSRRHVTLRWLTPGERVRLAVLPRKGYDTAEPDVLSNRVGVTP